MVYSGDESNRPKYNLIIAEEIKPFVRAEEYIDRSERECELKQILENCTLL